MNSKALPCLPQLLLMFLCSSGGAAELTTFEYLYDQGAIRDYVTRAEVVAIGRFGDFSRLDKQLGGGDSYSISSVSSFEVLKVLKGDIQPGNTYSLEISDEHVRHLPTAFSVAEYKEQIAARAREEIAENLTIFQHFEKLNEEGVLSARMLERIRVALEQAYDDSLATVREAVGKTEVTIRQPHRSTTPERNVMVGGGEVCLVLLTRVQNSFGEPSTNSYVLFPTDAYGLYKDVEMAYIEGFLEETSGP